MVDPETALRYVVELNSYVSAWILKSDGCRLSRSVVFFSLHSFKFNEKVHAFDDRDETSMFLSISASH